jgi:ribose 1,5-bisphosphate isomerase
MRIRGAGEIARSSVQALLITAKSSKANTAADFLEDLNSTAKMLLATRPTAVSLPNGIRYVMRRVTTQAQQTDNVDELRGRAIKTGEDFIANSLTAIARIGEIGAKRIRDGDKILTHCQSRAVSSVFKTAWNQGKRFEVVATETRPRFQGRITARDLGSTGIPVTLILDDAARYFMDKVDKVLVGADAVTANGALVNKIGTSLVALAAHEARVRVFVAAETYKFSPETMIGELIEIEERNPSEVISPGELSQLPHTVVRNPSFDVTPPEYLDLIITERGIIPPQAAVLILQEQFGFLTPEELTEYHTVRMAEQH